MANDQAWKRTLGHAMVVFGLVTIPIPGAVLVDVFILAAGLWLLSKSKESGRPTTPYKQRPNEAEERIAAGIDPDAARRWIAAGFTSSEATRWIAAGFTSLEAEKRDRPYEQDLHGYKVSSAQEVVATRLSDCMRLGISRIMFRTGVGNHSSTGRSVSRLSQEPEMASTTPWRRNIG